METRLIVVVVFFCTVCHLTEAQLVIPTALKSNITRDGCGSTKLCVSKPPNCNPVGSSSCFFSSTQFSNGALSVEISGTTPGYVALGLIPTTELTSNLTQNQSVAFVCGNNNNTNPFFESATLNAQVLTPANVTTLNITNVQGSVTGVIQCTFSVSPDSTLLNISQFTGLGKLLFNLTIFNGSTTGTVLGNPTAVFISSQTLDLANPRSNIPSRLDITRSGCGSTKLCVRSPPDCDPAGNANCFFSSIRVQNQNFSFELSGTTPGYVALGLTKQGTTTVFICGNDTNVIEFFFKTAVKNGASLTLANVNTVYFNKGVVLQSEGLIQCLFKTSINITTKAEDTSYIVSVMTGTTTGTDLGNPNSVFNSTVPLDLSDPRNNIPTTLNITRNGCNTSKLCFSSPSKCDPAGTSSCFFSSVQVKNQNFSFELSGTTTGYVALGLTKQGSTVVFVCGNDTNFSDFFFRTATKIGTSLVLANVSTVYNYQGVVPQNKTLIQCLFNTSTSFNTSISTKIDDTSFIIIIMNGTTTGTTLGDPTILFDSKAPLNLSDPTALNSSTSIISLWTQVMAVLLSALTLRLV